MLTRFGLAPRRAGISASDFQAHWRGQHASVVRLMPELKRYWQHHALLRDGEPLLPWAGFDACAQFEAQSLADYDRGFSSAHYLGPVRADEPNFVDNSRGGSMLCEQLLALDELAPEAGVARQTAGVRLLTFMRLAPLVPLARLAEALATLLPPKQVTGREVFVAAAIGQRASVFDALDVLLFPDGDAALAHVQRGEARLRSEPLAGFVRGTERLITQVLVVI